MGGNFSISDVEAFISRFYGGRKLLITPYGYNAQFSALAQGGSQTVVINIAANADFVLLGLRHRAQIGTAQTVSTKTAPFVRILFSDSGSNEQFTNTAVDLENYSSNGGYVQPLAYPRILSGRSTTTVQATNYAPTAETYTTIDVFMSGVLVRALSAQA